MSQEELARGAGVDPKTIWNIESGRTTARGSTVRRLADALDLDTSERQRFYAAAGESGPAAVPVAESAAAPEAVPAQLPPSVRGFSGRAAELRHLDALLPAAGAQPHAAVIAAVSGSPGAGKTALAVHWAHRVAHLFPDGQLFADLRGYSHATPVRPVEALARLLRGLGTDPDQVPVDEAEAAALYRSRLAGRRVLVVLDNARSADQVRPLLPGDAGCLVVVTSRHRLTGLIARDGAHRLDLGMLLPPDARHLLGHLLGEARLAAELDAADEMARLCAYLPLALRIAGAGLIDHPYRSIAEQAALLRGGDRLGGWSVDGDSEVRSAFDLSYRDVPARAQRLFRLLGLLPGADFTPAAAAALAGCPETEAETLLDRLASTHLVQEHRPGRYTFHDLIRWYARIRADEETVAEREAAQHRLAWWYLRAVSQAVARTNPRGALRLPLPETGPEPPVSFTDLGGALAWLDAERANLVAVGAAAAALGPRPVAWLLADTLRIYCYRQRHVVDWFAACRAAIAAARADGDLSGQASAHLGFGHAHWTLAQHKQALRHFLRAARLAGQAGWVEGEAAAVGNSGMAYHCLGELERAASQYGRAAELHRKLGRTGDMAANLTNLGLLYRDLGRLAEAVETQTRSARLFRELDVPTGAATAEENLGGVYLELGDVDRAEELLDRSLAVVREHRSSHAEAQCLAKLARIYRETGRVAVAIEAARTALAIARDTGDVQAEVEALNALASAEIDTGDVPAALGHRREALAAARQTAARYAQAETLIGLAGALLAAGRPGEAFEPAQEGYDLAHGSGLAVLVGQALAVLAEAHLWKDRREEAADHARRALDVHRRTGHRPGEARALDLLEKVFSSTAPDGAHEEES